MEILISERITIHEPTKDVKNYVNDNLVIPNPDYQKKERLGFSTYNTPKYLYMCEYYLDRDTVVIPYGCLRRILPLAKGHTVRHNFKRFKRMDFGGVIPLYDYQEKAVKVAISKYYGILQAPAGSGKTQMGLAIAQRCGGRTLWLTHTKDLLNQSKERAKLYFDESKFGEITEGKVKVGKTITFATIQTFSKLNLPAYKDMFDTVIVDECHRVSGTPTSTTQFSKVLNSLCAMHKYGLSATVHRADGLIKATYSLLGDIVYSVSEEEVADKVMKVVIQPMKLSTQVTDDMLNEDGTICWSKMITSIATNEDRNKTITRELVRNREHSCLILSDRVAQLKQLQAMLPDDLKALSAVIDAKMTSKAGKLARKQAIEDMRTGKLKYLFATYSLAKEGLDIPRLDRLFMVTPQKDYAIIVQSIGRIARTCEGKSTPIAYDYIDDLKILEHSYKKRCTTYRKMKLTINTMRFEE